MKTQVALFSILTALPFASSAATSTHDDSELNCVDQAKTELATRKRIALSSISFFNGASVGDGAASVEIDVLKVKGEIGLYKIEMDAEDCGFRNLEWLGG